MPPSTIWNQSLSEFRDRLASDQPTPGGGSAALVAATIGLGLVLMALRITAQKAPGARNDLIAAGDDLLVRIGAHADADVAAFNTYMAALHMPKETEEEEAARKAAIEAATREATETPLQAAEACLDGLKLAGSAAPVANAATLSDVVAGALLLHGALQAVLLIVDANLGGIVDGGEQEQLRERRAALETAAGAKLAAIRKAWPASR